MSERLLWVVGVGSWLQMKRLVLRLGPPPGLESKSLLLSITVGRIPGMLASQSRFGGATVTLLGAGRRVPRLGRSLDAMSRRVEYRHQRGHRVAQPP